MLRRANPEECFCVILAQKGAWHAAALPHWLTWSNSCPWKHPWFQSSATCGSSRPAPTPSPPSAAPPSTDHSAKSAAPLMNAYPAENAVHTKRSPAAPWALCWPPNARPRCWPATAGWGRREAMRVDVFGMRMVRPLRMTGHIGSQTTAAPTSGLTANGAHQNHCEEYC